MTDNRQPSPNWKTFNVEDIAVYRDPLVIHKNSQSASSSSSKTSDSGIVISSSSESSSKASEAKSEVKLEQMARQTALALLGSEESGNENPLPHVQSPVTSYDIMSLNF